MGRSSSTSMALIAVWMCVVSGAAAIPDDPPKPAAVPPPAGAGPNSTQAPKDPPKDAPATKPADPPKSLDELLGIPTTDPARPADGVGKAAGDDPAARQAKERLERGLSEKELDSLLQQALAGMKLSAEQLGDRTDTGLSTQRLQQDVVAKLDQLIEEAKRRSKKGSQSSSGSSSSGQSGQQQQKGGTQQQGDAQGATPGESKSRDGKRSTKGDGTNEGEGPAPVDPDADQAALDETQAEWGALPERVRDLIRQGSRDRIASLYQRLTQEYYRRMAEDASR